MSERRDPSGLVDVAGSLREDARISCGAILLIFVVAFGGRAGWGMLKYGETSPGAVRFEFPDEEQYWTIAESMASGEGMRDELGFRASRMPLYPAVLSLFAEMNHGIFWARAFHWFVGAVSAVVAGMLGARLLGVGVGVVAGLLVGIDPFFVFSSSLLLTETAFILALLLFLCCAVWATECRGRGVFLARIVVVGLIGSLCVYLRESSALLVVLVAGGVVWFRSGWRSGLMAGSGVLVVLVVSLLPWALRNRSVLGEMRWLTTRGGISLYDGVGPQADGTSDLGDIKAMPAVANLSELEWDSYFRREAVEAMRADPARVVRLGWVKFCRMWNPIPNVETYRSTIVRIIASVWTVPTFALAAFGCMIVCRRLKGDGGWTIFLLVSPAVYFSLLHCVFVGSVRYRLPAVAALEVLTAGGLIAVYDRLRRSRDGREDLRG